MMAYGESRYSSIILDLGIRWSELHIPGKTAPVLIGQEAGWVPNRSRICGEEKNLFPCQKSNSESSVVQSIA
jgi:hypothetical protein